MSVCVLSGLHPFAESVQAVFNVWLLLKWFCEAVAEILTFLAKYIKFRIS